MAEWSKAHAWKVCICQKRIMGSNPILSANRTEKQKKTKCFWYFFASVAKNRTRFYRDFSCYPHFFATPL